MRTVLWVVSLLSLASACGTAGNCTVSKDAATGVATISCPDGSSVEVAPGADGRDGAVGTNGADGADGANGAAGEKGEKGEVGTAGASCTVTRDADAGTTTIACADGTFATVRDGVNGTNGADGASGAAGTS